ncbi:tRNA (adenosine(37)-N6)-dimethylallyltransferase MiaA [Capilliphycus salinus ALCB114379]|uniref:tRNA (adenosine(37)-N6)-dimethylallyltransferase MiaA n=1 Tax=Capilliphycus salinus TaxID=2768948 RepID=UPI0039A785AC
MAIIVICGATATGKSGLAIALAQRLNTVILSADSRQVYREFDIGTAKPTLDEQEKVPHFLIDICDPTETLTLAEYQEKAQVLIAVSSATPVLLVGGTGLYIKSIVRGMMIPRVAPSAELRSQFQALGQVQCYAMLQQVDPVAAQKIHPNDEFRTHRALEVYYITGFPISQLQGEDPPDYPILQIGLKLDRDRLTERIQHRTHEMIERGWLEEVKRLVEKYGQDLPLLQTLGYQEMCQYLRGDCSLDEAITATVLHTRQFAKRQQTWFKAVDEIEWFDAENPDLLEQVWQRVLEFNFEF